MSYDDLEEHNIFLPEEDWDELDLSSSVNKPMLFVAMIIGVAACVLMVLGGGNFITWIGAGFFILFMYAFTLISNTGIENQNDLVDEVMKND